MIELMQPDACEHAVMRASMLRSFEVGPRERHARMSADVSPNVGKAQATLIHQFLIALQRRDLRVDVDADRFVLFGSGFGDEKAKTLANLRRGKPGALIFTHDTKHLRHQHAYGIVDGANGRSTTAQHRFGVEHDAFRLLLRHCANATRGASASRVLCFGSGPAPSR